MGEKAKVTAKKPEMKKSKTPQARKGDFNSPISSPIDHILFLQRTIGNQAVQRLFKSGVIQANLKIGQPGDIYEQEADRVADAVMRMQEPRLQRQEEEEEKEEEELIQTKPMSEQITPLVQRQVEEEEEEEEEEETIQAKETPGHVTGVTPEIESRITAIKGGGHPLPKSVRTFFEPQFGQNFSHVRIHTNPEVAETAMALNAQAFTIGQDVMFGAGQYAPETTAGKRILAHELTHVVQQNGNKVQGKFTIVNAEDKHEQDETQAHVYRQMEKKQETLHVKAEAAGVQRKEKEEKTLRGKTIVLKNIPWEPNYGLFENRVIIELQKSKYGLMIIYWMYPALMGESNLEKVTYRSLSPKGLAPETVTLRVDVRKGLEVGLPWQLSFSLLDFSVPKERGTERPEAALRKRVKLTFAGQEWDFGLLAAIDMIDNWTDAAISAIQNQRDLNKDQWIISFWSEALAGVNLPSPGRFRGVKKSLKDARKKIEEAYRPVFRDNPEWVENQLDFAEHHLKLAQIPFNSAYRVWSNYRKGVIKGAELGKRIIELTIVVITAPTGAPWEAALLSGVSEGALQFGKNIFLGDEINVVDIIQASATSHVASLISGKLRGLFDKSILKYGDEGLKLVNKLSTEQLKQGIQFSLDGVFNEFKGKRASTEEISKKLVDRAFSILAGMASP